METTLLILKPDAVQRRLMGRIIGRFEDKGLQVVGMKMMTISEELARKHYAAHSEKPFFPALMQYITSSPVVVMAVRGVRAIDVCRLMMGKTFGYESEAGTIRGDFGVSRSFNLIHGSDSPDAAEQEIALYFQDHEIMSYDGTDTKWCYDFFDGQPD